MGTKPRVGKPPVGSGSDFGAGSGGPGGGVFLDEGDHMPLTDILRGIQEAFKKKEKEQK